MNDTTRNGALLDSRTALGRWIVVLTALSVLTAGALAAMLIFGPPRATSERTIDLPKDFARIPEFSLLERSGRQVTERDLLGKVWIAGFVFTRCHDTCPMVAGVMARLRSELPAEIQMAAITVDPRYDKPAVLADYAKSLGADPESWWFLTGPREEVYRLVGEGFRLPVQENEAYKPGEGERVLHSTRLALVDRQGRVRATADASDPAAVALLKERALSLQKERP